jgi:hypothetical protein
MADNNRNEYFKEREGTDEARFHVVPHDNEGWAVKREGFDEPEYTGSRDEAITNAKELAREAGTMVYIHDDDGKIEEQLNYEE